MGNGEKKCNKHRFKRSVRLDILESQGYDNIKIVQR